MLVSIVFRDGDDVKGVEVFTVEVKRFTSPVFRLQEETGRERDYGVGSNLRSLGWKGGGGRAVGDGGEWTGGVVEGLTGET